MAMLEATVESGRLRGVCGGNQAVSLFLGIPYAKPPVGALRWRPPQPPEPWSGIRFAGEYGSIPMQRRVPDGSFFKRENYPVGLPRSEDCLYVNVMTPAESTEECLPVALWIYGGAFRQGYANKLETDGEAFAKRGVIFVSFNYRVDVFGYFTHPELREENEQGISGNYGLLDQFAALQWVRKNIQAFGGDPNRITVFGQSAGAMSAQMLVSMEQTKSQIQRAIFESGGGIGGMTGPGEENLASQEDMEAHSLAMLDQMGIHSLAQARQLSAEELLAGSLRYQEGQKKLVFMPVVDGFYIRGPLYELSIRGQNADIDYLLGCCSHESSTWVEEPAIAEPAQAYRLLEKQFGEQAKSIQEQMKKEDTFWEKTYLREQMTYKMYSGVLNWCAVREQMGCRPSYLYRFTRNIPDHPFGGTFHSGEHVYVFQTIQRSWRHYTGADYDLSNTVCDYWTNFIKTGNPNGEGLPAWLPYSSGRENCMELDQNCRMAVFPENPILRAEKERWLSIWMEKREEE